MNEPKHTPGPWELDERRDAHQWPDAYIIKGYGANVLACVYDTGNDHVLTHGQANARLIAAAPEMLAALQCAAAQLEEDFEISAAQNQNQQWIDNIDATQQTIRAAIAKAEKGA